LNFSAKQKKKKKKKKKKTKKNPLLFCVSVFCRNSLEHSLPLCSYLARLAQKKSSRNSPFFFLGIRSVGGKRKEK